MIKMHLKTTKEQKNAMDLSFFAKKAKQVHLFFVGLSFCFVLV